MKQWYVEMGKWVLRAILIGIVGFLAIYAYGFYRGGKLSLPDIPNGAYTIAFKNGLRAIVTDAEIEKPQVVGGSKYFRSLSYADPSRRYLGIPLDVAPWFVDAWSFCSVPTNEERAYYLTEMPLEMASRFEGARFDAVCRIDVDGQVIHRGLIFSVPRL